MFASKLRSGGAVVVLAIVALVVSVSFLPGDAQEPAKPAKLKELMKDRLAAATQLAKFEAARFKNAQGTVEDWLEAARLEHEAALDLANTNQERVALLQNHLARLQNIEGSADRLAKSGQARESTALKAKVERLRVQIALERAKAKQGGPAKGALDDSLPKKAQPGGARVLPCTVEAFESIRLAARVSGYLKTQNVDIGSLVKRDQVLAVIDVPELEVQLRIDEAALDKARARIMQAKARIVTAKAELDKSKLAVTQAEFMVKSAASSVRSRTHQYERMKALFANKAIEERIVEESRERLDAATESEKAALVAVASAKSQVAAANAKVVELEADVVFAEAGVRMAQAQLERSRVLVSFATIRSPIDGVITHRGHYAGDFIRAGDLGNGKEAMFTVQRMDRMRVVVDIPDRDVPFVEQGQPAQVEIDALPGKKWAAKVSRVAHSENPETRCMRVELDLANPSGQLRHGMYGKVSLNLSK